MNEGPAIEGPGGTYGRELLLALRLREVPSPRIAEALAEVDSHVTETGEDPVAAFGPPHEYAHELARALGVRRRQEFTTVAGVTGTVSCGLGGWLLADGVHALGAGTDAVLGLAGWAAALIGLVLLAYGALGVVRLTRRDGGARVTDPRTGADLRPPVPRWVPFALVGVPLVALVVSFGLGLLQRA